MYLLYTYCWYSVFYEIIESTNDSELLSLDIREFKNGRRQAINESKDESNMIDTVTDNNDTVTEYENEMLNVGQERTLCNCMLSCLLCFLY